MDVSPKKIGIRKSEAIRVRALTIPWIIENDWRAWLQTIRVAPCWYTAVQTIL